VTAAAGLRQEPDPLAPDDDGREAEEVAPGEAAARSETTPAEGVGRARRPPPARDSGDKPQGPVSDIIVTTSSKVIDLDDPR